MSTCLLVQATPPWNTVTRVQVRANMTLAVKRLVRDVSERLPALAHVRPSRVLIVAGEARGKSRATIRPASVPGPEGQPRRFMRVRGRRILYVITLRPLWFAASSPEERVSTILHELYHASTRFDGTLHRARRHHQLPRPAYDRTIRTLLDEYLASAPAELLVAFDGDGVVKVRMWLRAPRAEGEATTVDVDEHLIEGFMPLRTRARGARRRGRPVSRLSGHDEEEGA